ncbi:hypothetical protein LTR95_015661 [Oleoguttula sp. CCFEE 5521]
MGTQPAIGAAAIDSCPKILDDLTPWDYRRFKRTHGKVGMLPGTPPPPGYEIAADQNAVTPVRESNETGRTPLLPAPPLRPQRRRPTAYGRSGAT